MDEASDICQQAEQERCQKCHRRCPVPHLNGHHAPKEEQHRRDQSQHTDACAFLEHTGQHRPVHKPQGSIYLFPSIRESGLSSRQAAALLLEKAHVLTMPGDEFGACGEGYLRIACTQAIPVLEQAFDRIEQAGLFQKG